MEVNIVVFTETSTLKGLKMNRNIIEFLSERRLRYTSLAEMESGKNSSAFEFAIKAKSMIEQLGRMVRNDAYLSPDNEFTVIQAIDLVACKKGKSSREFFFECVSLATFINSFAGNQSLE